MDATDEVIGIMDRKQRDMERRIRELESELAVRDNMGNEVLRILREATGKRDFHSEMEAAEWAAKMLAEARRDGDRLNWLDVNGKWLELEKVLIDTKALSFAFRWSACAANRRFVTKGHLTARAAIDAAVLALGGEVVDA